MSYGSILHNVRPMLTTKWSAISENVGPPGSGAGVLWFCSQGASVLAD